MEALALVRSLRAFHLHASSASSKQVTSSELSGRSALLSFNP